MRKTFNFTTFTLVVLFVCMIENLTGAVSNVRFEEVQTINSLPQNMVLSIHQDKLGFIWLGTINGLHKYDGYEFKDYRFNDNFSNRIGSITEDIYGNLWLSTYDGRVLRFDPTTEDYISFPSEGDNNSFTTINEIFQTTEGVVCLATNNNGVYFIKEDNDGHIVTNHILNEPEKNVLPSNTITDIVQDDTGHIWLGTDNGLCRVKLDDLFMKDPAATAFFSSDETRTPVRVTTMVNFDSYIWIGTQKNGLLSYNTRSNQIDAYENEPVVSVFSESAVTVLKTDGNVLWAGNEAKELLRIEPDTQNFKRYKATSEKTGDVIKSIETDHEHQLWIITEAFGITRFDPQKETFTYYQLTPDKLSSLTDNERIVFLEDSRNNLWLGVHNVGVLNYDRENDSFVSYSYDPKDPSSLSSNIVECLYEDHEGNVWVGTNIFGKGLNRMIRMDASFSYYAPKKYQKDKTENFVRSMFYDSKGYLWVGTKGGKVYIYDSKMALIQTISKSDGNGFDGHMVYAINEDPDGYIWLATKGGGVYQSNKKVKDYASGYNGITFRNFSTTSLPVKSRLNNDNVYDIVFDDYGRAWLATYGDGLNMLDFSGHKNGESTFFTAANSKLTVNKLRDLYLSTDDRLWIGTTFGLNYIDLNGDKAVNPNDFKAILADQDNSKSLSNNDIVMILEDHAGRLWLATIGGGVNILTKPYRNSEELRIIKKSDGLSANITYSILEDKNNRIWISSENGLSRINSTFSNIENFDKNIGLPATFFSENTCTEAPNGDVLFGTINGFYRIDPAVTPEDKSDADIHFTSFQLNSKEIAPGQPGSILEKSIVYTKSVTLAHTQSNFAIEFAKMSFKAPESNQFEYRLEGFDKDWIFAGTDHKVTYTNLSPGMYTLKVRSAQSNDNGNATEATLDIKILPSFWVSYKAFILYVLVLILILYITFWVLTRINRLKNSLEIEHRVAESKLHFFTNISHQFKTPLTLIIGPIEKLITDNNLGFEVKRELEIMLNNSMRLLRMINQLLEFRKVMNKNIQLNVQEIELVPFLKQVMKSFQDHAKRKKIDTTVEFDSEDIKVWADFQKLDIVIFNLLSNAIKFTQDSGEVKIIVRDKMPTEEEVSIQIVDNGIGISEKKLLNLFNPLQDTGTRSVPYQGVGIGLSLSQSYVRLHQGEISVESEKGSGTTFTIVLKKGKAHFSSTDIKEGGTAVRQQAPPSLAELNIKDVEVTTTSKTVNKASEILLVENDTDLSKYIKSILDEAYVVHVANDGEEGLKMARDINPDMIVSDLVMPKMNGVEMTAHLKDDFETSHIPVLILSDKSESEDLVKGLNCGAEGYISKPFNNEVLLSYVNSVLKQRSNLRSRFDSIIELKPDEIRVQDKDKVFIEQVIKHIEDNISDSDFNVEKLAGMMNISRTLFYKKIKSISGFQPIELIRSIRFKKAAMLLKTGNYNITEVAYMLGYNDIRYFSTTFKKYYGKSPSVYQKENKQ